MTDRPVGWRDVLQAVKDSEERQDARLGRIEAGLTKVSDDHERRLRDLEASSSEGTGARKILGVERSMAAVVIAGAGLVLSILGIHPR